MTRPHGTSPRVINNTRLFLAALSGVQTRVMVNRTNILCGFCLLTWPMFAATSRGESPAAKPSIATRWAGNVQTEGDPFWAVPYPRPMLCRGDGMILDGLWDEAIAPDDAASMPRTFAGKILVPFSVGSPLSRVPRRPGAHEAIWYRRSVQVPPNWDIRSRHIWLNFNGLDGNAIVFVNEKEMGRHDGIDAFSLDITPVLKNNGAGTQEIAVEVLGSPSGCDGIWQTVWIAPLPPDHIDRLDVSLSSTDGNVRITAKCSGDVLTQRVEFVITDAGSEVARGVGKPGEAITLSIHDPKLWSPENPFLYDLHVELRRDKQRLDDATSCFGLRSIGAGKEQTGVSRILLNGKFEFEAGVIDAGRWPDGGSSAPSAVALRKDIEAVKQLGFNTIRKCGKIEPDYWYYRCDRLGILVWQDIPAGAEENDAARRRSLSSLVQQRGQHAAIVAWVVGGNGATAENIARDTKILKELDPNRLVIAASAATGAEAMGDAEILGIADADKIRAGEDRPLVIADFGGIASYAAGHSELPAGANGQTIDRSTSTEFLRLWEKTGEAREISAAFYRELTDVGPKSDGLISADREVIKLDLEMLASASFKTPLAPQIRLALPTSRTTSQAWLYTDKPQDGWNRLDGGTSSWKRGAGPFGSTPASASAKQDAVGTEWSGEELWARRDFTLEVATLSEPWLLIKHTGEVEIFVNNSTAISLKPQAAPQSPAYRAYHLDEGVQKSLREGRNVMAIHWRQPKAEASRFLDVGLVDLVPQRDCRLPKKLAHWPIVNAFFRDTCVCLADDGNYYLTGTTGDWGKEGIRIYRSTDLTHWDDLGLVWTPEKNATWQMIGRQRKNFCLWAPEIHFLKGTFWIPYCTSYAESADIQTGTGLLKSTSGRVEGPYVDISPGGRLTEGLDASIFQDDDGKVYFLHGGASIARMKDDMSGLAEKPHDLQLDGGGRVGYEGIYLFKHQGRYYWASTDNSLPDRDYDCFVAVSDRIEGPYHRRELAISHGGHNMFFQDKQGAWWSTMFGGDNDAPVIQKPGLIRIEFAPDGTVHPKLGGPS